MRIVLTFATAVLLAIGPTINAQPTATGCKPTTPNHHRMPSGQVPVSQTWHGNDLVGTDLWPDDTVVFRPGGPGFVLKDGSLQMKFLWFKARKPLTIIGRRLDGKPV